MSLGLKYRALGRIPKHNVSQGGGLGFWGRIED